MMKCQSSKIKMFDKKKINDNNNNIIKLKL